MKKLLPECRCCYKKSTSRIVYNIEEMVKKRLISKKIDGWGKITDMLRASFYCTIGKDVNSALDKLKNDDRVKMMRIRKRFSSSGDQNDICINFNYRG